MKCSFCVFGYTQIETCQQEIFEKEKQLYRLQEQEKALSQSYTESIGDNNKFKDFLLKVRYGDQWSLLVCG